MCGRSVKITHNGCITCKASASILTAQLACRVTAGVCLILGQLSEREYGWRQKWMHVPMFV